MSDVLRTILASPPLAFALLALIAAVMALLVYAIWSGREVSLWPPRIGPRVVLSPVRVKGSRLFQHTGYYPIDIDPETNNPNLNSAAYVRAMLYLLDSVHDRLAAMDLVYLREDNWQAFSDVLPPEHGPTYDRLLKKYDLREFRVSVTSETDRLFRNAERIINDLGATLRGIKCEFVLHDVRNPLRSIVALANTREVSGRRLHAPSTRFVVNYLKHQGRHLIELEQGSHVAYAKWFLKTKQVKATTTPLFDERYGLIGLLCVNIDIDAIKVMSDSEKKGFFEAYMETSGITPEYERDDAPSRAL